LTEGSLSYRKEATPSPVQYLVMSKYTGGDSLGGEREWPRRSISIDQVYHTYLTNSFRLPPSSASLSDLQLSTKRNSVNAEAVQ